MGMAACTATKSASSDPIDQLVAQYNSSHGLWINGTYPIIELPPDAKPKEVLDQAVRKWGFDQGYIKSYKIQEVRKLTKLYVGEREPLYTAALIESDLGPKIFLFRPEMNNRWWVRFCSLPEEKNK
jgi:hypothetical protein